ncbi:histone-lysine N-methyltransferase 2B-like, partial [Catharus ustulatus]|uniref:histone-lysine N-methyltransferase 2B-like n=1 Tax=Catharus ustulatus TaxID=91951 RepID=UPI0014092ACF
PSPPLPHLRFEISSEDGLRVTAPSLEGAWRAVLERVQEARASAHLGHLSFAGMSGLRLLGIHHDAVVFLLEQLPGAGSCSRYRFRYHPPRRDPPHTAPPRNPSGCARAELYLRKCTFDMFSFLASQHRALPQGPPPREEEEDEVQLKPTRRATSLELPMAMRFRHLKRTAKEAVGVYRSAIHGRGLFCKRNIEAGEMVIEYSGIVVRSVLTDKREKFYDSKGIGCYMFRIDEAEVVDATMHGSAARFINHSCEPNCYSRVIHVEGHKRIVIFALRRILRGEELTYDYKFPIEEPAAKLPCNCGARRCRRFLN